MISSLAQRVSRQVPLYCSDDVECAVSSGLSFLASSRPPIRALGAPARVGRESRPMPIYHGSMQLFQMEGRSCLRLGVKKASVSSEGVRPREGNVSKAAFCEEEAAGGHPCRIEPMDDSARRHGPGDACSHQLGRITLPVFLAPKGALCSCLIGSPILLPRRSHFPARIPACSWHISASSCNVPPCCCCCCTTTANRRPLARLAHPHHPGQASCCIH